MLKPSKQGRQRHLLNQKRVHSQHTRQSRHIRTQLTRQTNSQRQPTRHKRHDHRPPTTTSRQALRSTIKLPLTRSRHRTTITILKHNTRLTTRSKRNHKPTTRVPLNRPSMRNHNRLPHKQNQRMPTLRLHTRKLQSTTRLKQLDPTGQAYKYGKPTSQQTFYISPSHTPPYPTTTVALCQHYQYHANRRSTSHPLTTHSATN